ncbi:MAG: ATP-binding protein [Algoriphagus sp.]|nr:ATP-binding protein [Algoriphagus sp.]
MDIASLTKANAKSLATELQWLNLVINTRMSLYWGKTGDYKTIYDIKPPDLANDTSYYAQLVAHFQMDFDERIILILSLVPHVQPQLLDVFFVKNANYDRGFTELGGIKGKNHCGFIPTGETAAFILAANSLENRFRIAEIFGENHFFHNHKILRLNNAAADEPFLSGVLNIYTEYLNYFTSSITHKTDYNINFPAKRITTGMDWSDLVLEDHTLKEVMEISDWIKYGDHILNDWGFKKKIKPGYRVLFYGPPGTGKTLTASLLGKTAGLEVYRIDLSMTVLKYIGETEKNLANIFDQAETKNWLLFFDEADALFGKRTQTSSSNDRHANQEISYLLQRIEDYPGVVMMATNLKANLDEAFTRRFQSMIYFAIPNAWQRKKLWQNSFSDRTLLEEKIDLNDISSKYELTGGAIINIARFSSLMAMKRNDNIILLNDLMEGIRREFGKDGKIVGRGAE